MKLNQLLLVLAALPLMAGTCGGDDGDPDEAYTFHGDDGPKPRFLLSYIDAPYPEFGSVLELSEADAALTESGETRVASTSGNGYFPIKLRVEFADLTYPYCLSDDVVLDNAGDRTVIAPAGTVCINEPEEADRYVVIPIEQ